MFLSEAIARLFGPSAVGVWGIDLSALEGAAQQLAFFWQDDTAPLAPKDLITYAGDEAIINFQGVVIAGGSKTLPWSTRQGLVADIDLIGQAIDLVNQEKKATRIRIKTSSPGGYVLGGDTFRNRVAASIIPIVVDVDGMCCSMAYWCLSPVDQIVATETSQLGNVGVFTSAVDASKAYEKEGLERIVFASGPLKGAFIEGSKVTDEQRQATQKRIEEQAALFFSHVSADRKLTTEELDQIKTGDIFGASAALKLHLIDKVIPTSTKQARARVVPALAPTPTPTSATVKARKATNKMDFQALLASLPQEQQEVINNHIANIGKPKDPYEGMSATVKARFIELEQTAKKAEQAQQKQAYEAEAKACGNLPGLGQDGLVDLLGLVDQAETTHKGIAAYTRALLKGVAAATKEASILGEKGRKAVQELTLQQRAEARAKREGISIQQAKRREAEDDVRLR